MENRKKILPMVYPSLTSWTCYRKFRENKVRRKRGVNESVQSALIFVIKSEERRRKSYSACLNMEYGE